MKRRRFLTGAVASASLLLAGLSRAQDSTTRHNMKILVLTGSPRRHGNSNYLADRFIAGAQEAGHSVTRFDCAQLRISPCLACNACGMNGPCVQKDDFALVRPHIIEADMITFATPMYYFGFSAQLKTVIDRFYAINSLINGAPKKTALLMTYADNHRVKEDTLLAHFHTLAAYMGWEEAGIVVAPGVWIAGAVKDTPYPERAYELGRGL